MSRTYTLGSWNLRLGQAIDDAEGLLDDEGLDVLAVQEVVGGSDKWPVRLRKSERLRRVVRPYRLRLSTNRETGIVVVKGLRLSAVRRHKITKIGWERGKGRPGEHPPRKGVSVRLGPRGRAGIRLLSVHLPPGPDSWDGRGRARAQALRRIERIARRWNRAVRRGHIGGWVLYGDWNHPAGHAAIRLLAKRAGARIVGTGVDFALVSRSLTVGDHGRAPKRPTSDHTPRVLTITTPA